MADLAIWVEAAAPALGLERGQFLRALDVNRARVNRLQLQSSSFCTAVVQMMLREGAWSGDAATLMKVIPKPPKLNFEEWPTTEKMVTTLLRRYAPCVRAEGLDIDLQSLDTQTRRRVIRIARVAPTTPPAPSDTDDTYATQNKADQPNNAPATPPASDTAKDAKDAKRSTGNSRADLYDAAERAAIQDDPG
jgi:hypothetical protein